MITEDEALRKAEEEIETLRAEVALLRRQRDQAEDERVLVLLKPVAEVEVWVTGRPQVKLVSVRRRGNAEYPARGDVYEAGGRRWCEVLDRGRLAQVTWLMPRPAEEWMAEQFTVRLSNQLADANEALTADLEG